MFRMDGNVRRNKAREREREKGEGRRQKRKEKKKERKESQSPVDLTEKTYRYPMERRYPPRTS